MTDAQYHGCRGAEEMHEEFQTVLREHLARYPLMEPQDCAKLAYQSTFGPAHAAGERGDVLRQLLGECSALPADREARPPERIGNGLCRVHLAGTGDWTLAAPLLADLLLLTAAEHHGTAADLEECLTAAEALPLPGMADWLAVYRRQGCPPSTTRRSTGRRMTPTTGSCGQHTAGTSRHCWRRPGWRGAADQPSWPLTAAAAAARAAWET